MVGIFFIVNGCLFFVLLLASVAIIGRYIVGPLVDRRRQVQTHTQFMMSDIIWLVVMLQVAMAPIAALTTGIELFITTPIFGLISLGVLALWWYTIRALSWTGVKSAPRRGMLILVVVPLTLALSIGWAPAFFLLADGIMRLFDLWDWRIETAVLLPLSAMTVFGAIPLAWLLRRATLWALDDPAAVAGEET